MCDSRPKGRRQELDDLILEPYQEGVGVHDEDRPTICREAAVAVAAAQRRHEEDPDGDVPHRVLKHVAHTANRCAREPGLRSGGGGGRPHERLVPEFHPPTIHSAPRLECERHEGVPRQRKAGVLAAVFHDSLLLEKLVLALYGERTADERATVDRQHLVGVFPPFVEVEELRRHGHDQPSVLCTRIRGVISTQVVRVPHRMGAYGGASRQTRL